MANLYKFRQWSLTIFRVVLGFIFAYHGYLKLFVPGGFKMTAGFMASIFGVSPFAGALIAVVVSVVEFAGGLFLIAGFLAKWSSMLLIIDMLVAIFKVHVKNGFLIANGGFEFAALLALSSLVILLNGPGALSLDRAVFVADDKDDKGPKESRKSGKRAAQVKNLSGNGIIARTGIEKESGYLYFLDKNGDVARVRMARRGEKTSRKHEVVAKVGVERKQGFLYFIDKNGNISQTKMARG